MFMKRLITTTITTINKGSHMNETKVHPHYSHIAVNRFPFLKVFSNEDIATNFRNSKCSKVSVSKNNQATHYEDKYL